MERRDNYVLPESFVMLILDEIQQEDEYKVTITDRSEESKLIQPEE